MASGPADPVSDAAPGRMGDAAPGRMGDAALGRMGIVAIGRNEGARLEACLRALPEGHPVVYVDSGSTDGSVAFARARGATVVELAMDRPFTAARARNAGLDALLAGSPEVALVQMLDGDCVLDGGWTATARAALAAEPDLAVVFGRRRERFPGRSVYNRLCDEEWDVPVGEAKACGGDALFRVAPLRAAGGYDPTLIAGEEPDLCLRLRRDGWRIRRIDAEMTGHDAAMTRFGQWWRRTQRAGHAYAEHAHRHGAASDLGWGRAVGSAILWAAVLPALAIGAAATLPPWAPPLLLLAYPAQVARMAWRKRRGGAPGRLALASAGFTMLGKFAHLAGIAQFHRARLSGRRTRLIEYKDGATA